MQRYRQFDKDVLEDLWKKQGKRCPICQRSAGFHFRVPDHCHRCGLLRAIVCDSCNSRVGYYEEVLRGSGEYPSEPKAGCPHLIKKAKKLAREQNRIIACLEAHRKRCAFRLRLTKLSSPYARLRFPVSGSFVPGVRISPSLVAAHAKPIPKHPKLRGGANMICDKCSSARKFKSYSSPFPASRTTAPGNRLGLPD